MGKRCFICMKEKDRLYNGMCAECHGKGSNVSLLSAISDKDNALVKKIEKMANSGQIVRIM